MFKRGEGGKKEKKIRKLTALSGGGSNKIFLRDLIMIIYMGTNWLFTRKMMMKMMMMMSRHAFLHGCFLWP